jgi:hypothetical protein
VAGRAAVAAGPAAVIEQDNVTFIDQFGNQARRDRMTAPVAVVEVGEGQQTSDRSPTEIVSASAAYRRVSGLPLGRRSGSLNHTAALRTEQSPRWRGRIRRDRSRRVDDPA